MNTKINLTYKDETYTLEFDRMVIKLLEKSDFDFNEFLKRPMTNIELAFAAAFIKNHPNVKQETVDAIFESCPNKNNLIATISAMIEECYSSLLAEPDEDDSKNVKWEIVDLTPKKVKNQE